MKRHALTFALFLCVCAFAAGAAEPAGPASMVCALGRVSICAVDGCKEADVDAIGVPGLVRLDFGTGEMHAVTAADAGRRSTFKVLERKDGKTTLQGFENGRAFSLMITEQTGLLTAAVAREGLAVTAFGACTPLPAEAR